MKIKTTERLITADIDGKSVDICHWRRGIDRVKKQPVAIIDINYDFVENSDIEELTKRDAQVLIEGLSAALEDIEKHGL